MSPELVLNAIYLGVHTPGDSDSIASLTGALAGAHCGDMAEIRPYVRHIEDSDHICIGGLLVAITDKETVGLTQLEKSQNINR